MNLNRFFDGLSLKAKVTLLTPAIFVVGVCSLTFYASRVLRENMQRQLGEQQLSPASLPAAHVNNALGDRVKALEAVTTKISRTVGVVWRAPHDAASGATALNLPG